MVKPVHPTFPAILSFCLPGLGQIALGRTVIGVVFFAGFIALILISPLNYLLPIFAGAVSYHAFRLGRDGARVNSAFQVVTMIGGFLGFFCWMLLFASRVLLP